MGLTTGIHVPVVPNRTAAFFAGAEALSMVRAIAATATHSLDMEIFKLEGTELDGMVAAIRDGVQGALLVSDHPDAIRSADTVAAASSGLQVGIYGTQRGDDRTFTHAKAVVADRERLLVTTSPWKQAAERYQDWAILTDGRGAELVSDATRAAAAGRYADSGAALLAAAEHGVVATDPLSGVATLSTWLDSTLAGLGRGDELLMVTKRVNDEEVGRALAAAAERGASIRIKTGKVRKEVQKILRPTSVDVDTHPVTLYRLHGNLIISGDDVYAGTAYLSPRPLGRPAPGEEASRELGMVVRDPDIAARARLSWDET